MIMSHKLQSTGQEPTLVSIPRYSVRLFKESRLLYDIQRLTGAELVRDLLKKIRLQDKAVEEFHVLYLNSKNQVIGMEMVSKGTLNASLVHPREVFKGAILANANSVVLAHNHPSGDVNPSNADKQVTKTIVEAGKIMDIKVLDHVIIGSTGGYFSFSESSLLDD